MSRQDQENNKLLAEMWAICELAVHGAHLPATAIKTTDLRDVAQEKYHLSTRGLFRALFRLREQGIVGFVYTGGRYYKGMQDWSIYLKHDWRDAPIFVWRSRS